MFAHVLHGALALSLAPAPAPPAEPEPAPTNEPSADDTPAETSPEADPPADEASESAEPPTDPATPPSEDGATPTEDAAPPVEAADDEPAPEAAPTTEQAPLATPPPTASAPPPAIARTMPPKDGRNDDMVNRALLGGGIASLVLAGGLGGVATWSFIESARFDRIAKGEEGIELSNDDAARNRDRLQVVGSVTAAVGATYLITGTALLLLRQRDRKRSDKATATIAPTHRGLVISGRF